MNPGDDRWRPRGQPPNASAANQPHHQQQQQQRSQGGQRRNVSHDRNSYSGQGGYGGGGGGRGNNNGNNNNNAWTGGMQQNQSQHQTSQQGSTFVEGHIPVNGFNSKDVEEFLCHAYEKELMAARGQGPSQGMDESQRPIIFKSDKGWSTPKSSGPWGSRSNQMANGTNFLNQIKKSQATLQASGGGGGGGGKE